MRSLQSAIADAQSANARVTQLQAEVFAFPSVLGVKEQELVEARELAQVL